MQPAKRAAFDAGLPRYEGTPCKRGHGATRYTSTGECVVCSTTKGNNRSRKQRSDQRAAQAQERAEIRAVKAAAAAERRRLKDVARYAARRDSRILYMREYYRLNKEKLIRDSIKYQQSKPEKRQAIQRRYYEKNAHKIRAAQQRRFKHAVPCWLTPLDFYLIGTIYAECRRVSRVTGTKHHVDHIIPINGKNVCGLHTLTNLQILPAVQNRRKSNK